jgi:hypothetical protein
MIDMPIIVEDEKEKKKGKGCFHAIYGLIHDIGRPHPDRYQKGSDGATENPTEKTV